MKLQDIKVSVYESLKVKNTEELRIVRPDLVQGLDLRKKQSWQHIQSKILSELNSLLDKTIEDAISEANKSNQIIGKSLDDWENFKRKTSNISSLENEEKLYYFSDYKHSKARKNKLRK
jgi:hypothetical protein